MAALESRTKASAPASVREFIVGPKPAVEQQIARLAAAGRLDAKAPMKATGPNEVTVSVWLFPATETPRASRIHPAWVLGILIAASALVAAVAWLVLVVATVVALYGAIILGVLVVGTGVAAVLGRGDSFTQIMNIHR